MNSGNGTIKTVDLGLAVFLYSLGAELTSIDRTDPRQAVFAFELTPDKKEEISKWQNGTAMVNALAFWSAYQQVKIALHKSR